MCVAAAGCSSDEPFAVKGEGTVYLSATISSDVKVRSRATMDEIKASCMVWISNSKGLVRRFDNINDVPETGIKLLCGNYIGEAWAGDSVPASFEDRYFKGRQEFQVERDKSTAVEITCTLANSVVQVNYDAEVFNVLTDVVMTVGHSQGSLAFEGATDAKGYFMMNSRDKGLTYTLTGKYLNGNDYTTSGVIENCKPATLYMLNVRCNTSDTEIGGAYFTIEVDESTIDVEDEITIKTAPVIRGYGFDISTPIRAEEGAVGRKTIYAAGSSELKEGVLECSIFSTKLGINGNDFDFFRMDETVAAAVEAGGITYQYTYDATKETSTLQVNFEETFTNSLTEGEYAITFTATDANNKTSSAVLTIIISDAPVATGTCEEATIWATKATITGEIVKDTAVNPVLKYRKYGTSSWIVAETTINGTTLTAELTGLEAGTKYEYTAATDDYDSSEIKSFTTEAATQLPNSSFENWITESKVKYAATSTSDLFWDTGNTGSSTMSKNVTYESTDYVNSGSYSACLQSQFVGVGTIGKFAAGNIFVGKYLATVGMDGVLGWGRAWSSRPTKLAGYFKYTPAEVAYESSDYSALKKGDMDKGIIYIALLDDSQMMSYDGNSYPFVIQTSSSSRQLFDSNSANIIAYGSYTFDTATAGDGLVYIEIPLEYRRTDVKPSYIMCTASASIGGDYFVGGPSIMYIDDLTLIYE